MILRRQAGVFLAALFGAVIFLVLSSSARGQASPVEPAIDEDPGGAPYAAGELIVTYKENASDKKIGEIKQEAKAAVEEEIPEIDTQVLEFPGLKNELAQGVREKDLEQKKEALKEDPTVESVDYNYLRTGSYTPSDPRFRYQWGLRKSGFERAWNRTRGRGTKIALVDSGVSKNHVDLRRKVVAQWDFHNDNRTVEDLNGHGTHVAGIMAAKAGNGRGVVGGCPGCRLIVAKALDRNLFGYDSNVIKGILWSAKQDAKVINLSLGSTAKSDAIRRAVNQAQKQGAVVVAAGGNYGNNTPVYPAAYGGVIGVSHTDRYDHRVFDASYGGWIDVAAPGYDILSTVPGGYGYKNGSSMAAPHVSALAGLLASQRRGPAVIQRRILFTAQDIGPRGRDRYYGYGRINAARAVR